MRKSDFDSRILIYRSRKMALLLAMILASGCLCAVLIQADLINVNWRLLILPVTMFGSLFILFPPTEEWEYKPWQGKPRKIEQHFDE